MGNLFQILFSAIKAKIVPIWTKLKLWTNLSFLRTRVFTKIRNFFTKMLDIKPRNKLDYYNVFGWLVSKRLVIAVLVVVGLVSAYYVFIVQGGVIFGAANHGIKTYNYDAVSLRFTDGTVRIKARSGYVAYEGSVKKGKVTGKGLLYRKDGSLLYDGQFENNKYNGAGKLYFPSEQLRYQGTFYQNLFDGMGTLYHENGNLEYEGSFLLGMKEGAGILYDSVNNPIFSGNFSKDRLSYTDFLGKNTEEAGELYTGTRTVYSDSNYFVVDMSGIHASYYGYKDINTLDESIQIEGIYVREDSFYYGGKEYTNVLSMKNLFEQTEYEGNAYITMPEATQIHIMNQNGKEFYGDVAGDWNKTFDDAITVDSYDMDYTIYLYTFQKEGIRYTFFCKDRSGTFSMYLMEKAS